MSITTEIERIQNAKASIKTAIENKGVEVGNGTIDTYASKIDEISVGGSIDYIPYVRSVGFSSAISEITDDIYLDLSNVTSLDSLFYNITLNCNKVTIKLSSKCNSFRRVFMRGGGSDNLKIVELIGDTSQVTRCDEMFKTRTSIEKILGELDFSSVTTFGSWFMNCSKLKEIYPKAGTIKTSIGFDNFANLTDETVQAIINGLADLTGATAQILTVHADVKAKIEANPTLLASITSKNWTLA